MLLNGLFRSSSHHSTLIKKSTANTSTVTHRIKRQLLTRQVNHHHFTTNRSTYFGTVDDANDETSNIYIYCIYII